MAALRPIVKAGTGMPPSRSSIGSIVVVRQHDQLGDMLCTIPLLRALRAVFPAARITLVSGIVNHEIMLHHPSVNLVLQFPKGNLISIVHFGFMLRKSSYDMAIVPSTVSFSFTSAVVSLISGAGTRIGAKRIDLSDNPAGFCYTNGVGLDWRSDPHRHQALRNLDVLHPLDIEWDDLSTTIGITIDEKRVASTLLAGYHGKYRWLVGIHPGAGKKENRWPVERFAELVNRIAQQTMAGVVISIGPMDNEVFEQITPHIRCEYILLRNKPIREVAAVIDQLDLFISNDTGVMHVAGATSTRLLALFGPTDPLQWAPVGKKNHYIAAAGGDIRQITVDEVARMALLVLSVVDQST